MVALAAFGLLYGGCKGTKSHSSYFLPIASIFFMLCGGCAGLGALYLLFSFIGVWLHECCRSPSGCEQAFLQSISTFSLPLAVPTLRCDLHLSVILILIASSYGIQTL